MERTCLQERRGWGESSELQGVFCLKKTVPIPPGDAKRNTQRNGRGNPEGHAFCPGVVSEVLTSPALLGEAYPVLRKWPDPDLAT